MPNWAYNNMTVQGPNEDLERFLEAIRLPENDGATTSMGADAGNYDLALLYPTPKELAETTSGYYTAEPHPNWAVSLAEGKMTQEWYDELVRTNAEGYKRDQENLAKYGYKNWYDWNCDNWGTKWSPRVEQVEFMPEHKQIAMYYETAWCPASGLIRKISELFPTLLFTVSYEEESDAFIGCEMFHQGRLVGKDYDPYAIDELPERFRQDVADAQAKVIQSHSDDPDSDDWVDARIDLTDLYHDVRDYVETEVTEMFAKEYPDAFHNV